RMMGHVLQAGSQPLSPAGPERLVTGHDLMEHFDLSPGPQVGRLLETVNEARAAGEITTLEEALSLVAEVLGSPSGGE
ncbi:MAG: metal-dependent phosphohydrolase, partial [Chloroflexota bacterium]